MIERYQSKAITQIFSEENRFALFIEIEALLLEALSKHFGIGKRDINELRSLKGAVDTAAISSQESVTRHEVTAFLEWIWSRLPGNLKVQNYLHLGLTSSDLMDTALSCQMVQALDLVMEEHRSTQKILRLLSLKYRSLPVMGRTHGIHAETTSLGLKFLGFWAEGARHGRRLKIAREEIATGKLSGSVGSFASGEAGPDEEKAILAKLGLSPEPVATQVVPRDRHAAVLSNLALLGAWIERLATEIRHGQRTEVGEIIEPFGRGQHGSSSMPHKKNPILSENLCGLARLLRSYALAAFENVALWHERDISHSSVERCIIPDAFHAAHFALRRLQGVLSGLIVNEEAIKRNAALLGDLTSSQAYLNRLIASGMARKEAYALIQSASLRAQQEHKSLWQMLQDEKGVLKAKLKPLKPADFLRQIPKIYQRTLKKGY
ncbi:MAG: adenylosuccinate lyase [Elusimicrobia bacterium]|nr:adenylosuccinate lyase [Elusimicrobiota bacterium]